MAYHTPFQVIGYHSCDREVGLRVLNGKDELKPSKNPYDWLGHGIYFWEQNPKRGIDYATDCVKGIQFYRGSIKNPFVIGAIVELGNCLNLVSPEFIKIIEQSYSGLVDVYAAAKKLLPINDKENRRLDCTVIETVHDTIKKNGDKEYDTVRSSFLEGEAVYPNASFYDKVHIQVCVRNPEVIKGYFLPRPILEYNPYLDEDWKNE